MNPTNIRHTFSVIKQVSADYAQVSGRAPKQCLLPESHTIGALVHPETTSDLTTASDHSEQ